MSFTPAKTATDTKLFYLAFKQSYISFMNSVYLLFTKRLQKWSVSGVILFVCPLHEAVFACLEEDKLQIFCA